MPIDVSRGALWATRWRRVASRGDWYPTPTSGLERDAAQRGQRRWQIFHPLFERFTLVVLTQGAAFQLVAFAFE